jgi:flagellum-specific peptidoglycan hydrolase FlgJ
METESSGHVSRREFLKQSSFAGVSLFLSRLLHSVGIDSSVSEVDEAESSAETMVSSNNPRIDKYLSREHLYGPATEKNYAERIQFINRYRNVAVSEQAIYHIPASITLAQGILESRSGQSDLARYNNFFGIKCRDNAVGCKCQGHYIKDDPEPSYFTKYQSPWFGFRGHSKFIAQDPDKRYKSCFDSKLYNDWAFSLGRAGYAVDPGYAAKLIKIIFQYKLFVYDEEVPDTVVLPK